MAVIFLSCVIGQQQFTRKWSFPLEFAGSSLFTFSCLAIAFCHVLFRMSIPAHWPFSAAVRRQATCK